MTTATHSGGLLFDGQLLMEQWCFLNTVRPPEIKVYVGRKTQHGVCAYYRDGVIHIWPDACAALGLYAWRWSWPGYTVDRTPYGVLAHELGHHVEQAHGARGGIVASEWRRETGDAAITSYAENDNEWFAELFRVFVTNPDLLTLLRPKMFARLIDRWPRRAEARDWRSVLALSPRHIGATTNKINAVDRKVKS